MRRAVRPGGPIRQGGRPHCGENLKKHSASIMPSLATDALGTAHSAAECLWCGRRLMIASVGVPALRCWVCPGCYGRQLACAIVLRSAAGSKYPHVPLPSQVPLYEAANAGGYLLWGGRAGPGKSTGVRWLAYHRSLSVAGHESLLLRENWDQLQANHTMKMAHEVPALGGRWLAGDRMAVFGKGSDQSVIYCGHMSDADALQRYIGIEYGLIVPDEAALYPVDAEGTPVLAELSTRARKDYTDRAGRPVKGVFLPTTNPGGPSAQWLKDMFIDHTPDYEQFPALVPTYHADGTQDAGYRPDQWRYVSASLRDNPYMRPDYAQTNLAVLSGTRYKQLAEGDWYASALAFFRDWAESAHVVEATIG